MNHPFGVSPPSEKFTCNLNFLLKCTNEPRHRLPDKHNNSIFNGPRMPNPRILKFQLAKFCCIFPNNEFYESLKSFNLLQCKEDYRASILEREKIYIRDSESI